jgi:hypothetical protein
MTLAYLISPASWALFNGPEISDTAWLKIPPSTWGGNESYEKLILIVTQLLITNQCAERGSKAAPLAGS